MLLICRTAIRMLSTDKLYRNPNITSYVGKYVEYRKMIDYEYFGNYTHERQLLQDAIIDDIFKNKNQLDKNSAIYTSGCYGSGKTHTLKYLSNIGVLDLNTYALIDPDKISYKLPEMSEFIKKDPITAGNLIHNEAIFIAMLAEYFALSNGYAYIVDGSLQNSTWYKSYFETIKKQYPDYTFGIIKVNAPLDIIKERCKKRGEQTGRVIDDATIEKIYKRIPEAYEILSNCVDWAVSIENAHDVIVSDFKIDLNIYR